MDDDYLWDGTGDPSVELGGERGHEVAAEVFALQRTLAPLRYEPDPLRAQRAPAQPRASAIGWAAPLLAAAAAALLVLGLRVQSIEAPDPLVAVTTAEAPETVVRGPDVAAPEATRVSGDGETESPASSPPRPLTRDSKEELPVVLPKARTRKRSPKPAETTRADVDCILDPTKCTKGRQTKARRKSTDRVPTVDCVLDPKKCEPRPETLSSSDIRRGMLPVKSRAQACGAKHGAPAGSRVKIKLSILGATGRVLGAVPTGDWTDTPLGRCVAAAASKARFPRFKKARLGVVYPFTTTAATSPEPPASATALMRQVSGRVNVKAGGCALAHDVPVGTRVDVELKISAAGKVTKVRVLPRDTLSSDAKHCLSAAIGKTRFSRSDSGVSGRIPLSL